MSLNVVLMPHNQLLRLNTPLAPIYSLNVMRVCVCVFYRLGFPVLTAGSVIRLCTDNGEDQSPLRGFLGG